MPTSPSLTPIDATGSALAPDVAQILRVSFDPRGRLDRRGMFIVAIALLVLQVFAGLALLRAGVPADAPLSLAVAAVFLWIGFAAVSKRLHDIGRSAWMFPLFCLAWVVCALGVSLTVYFVFGDEALVEGTATFRALVGGLVASIVAALVWLHVRPGMVGVNAYGPPPVGSGHRA
jgi:uncharacterized membrane protein YhaH (DUF805 family)